MKRDPNRVPPEDSRPYGCEELHMICLIPHHDDHGPGICFAVMLPEAKADLPTAIAQTKKYHARLLIVCDTARQAKRAKKIATRQLDGWTEVSYAELKFSVAGKYMAEASGQTRH